MHHQIQNLVGMHLDIKLNGLIEQSGYVSTVPSSATYTISGLLFTSTGYTILFHTEGSDRSARDFRLMNVSDRNSNSYKFTMYAGGASPAEFSWYAFGY